MKEPDLKLPQPLARALLNYLIEKPYKEVVILINALNTLEREVVDAKVSTNMVDDSNSGNSLRNETCKEDAGKGR